MTPAGTLLELGSITKTYRSPGGVDTEVLRSISLKIDAGESVAIVGPSGCGKSTLLNIIGTLDRPTSGTVHIEGREATAMTPSELAEVRTEVLGFVFQLHHLLPQCSILENVLVPTLVSRESKDATERARKLLDRVGLSDRINHRPGQLSGGECQRVALVRALINRPRLLLADEPTGSLDGKNADALAELLGELNREEGIALVMVTHSSDLAGRAGRVLELRDGTIASP